jgi:hypothetical protein
MFRVKVIPEDGEPYEVKTTTRDIAQWERRNKGASFAGLQADMHMTDLYKVTHLAAVRQGQFTGSLNDFENMVDLDILDSEDEPDPTQSEASAETS